MGNQTLDLNIRVHDREHNDAYTDRFNELFSLNAGAHELRISLSDLRNAPRGRKMDMSDIEPRSALKQAASDRGIDWGDDMLAFVTWAESQLQTA